jgi:hypothetical protein
MMTIRTLKMIKIKKASMTVNIKAKQQLRRSHTEKQKYVPNLKE